jgi:hypothetical protein
MNTLQKEFVPYEQALALKKLGFDEDCFKYYNEEGALSTVGLYYGYDNPIDFKCLAPIYQQVFRWFREEYNLREQYGVFPHHTIMMNYLIEGGREEEAELECLKKLIQIVK